MCACQMACTRVLCIFVTVRMKMGDASLIAPIVSLGPGLGDADGDFRTVLDDIDMFGEDGTAQDDFFGLSTLGSVCSLFGPHSAPAGNQPVPPFLTDVGPFDATFDRSTDVLMVPDLPDLSKNKPRKGWEIWQTKGVFATLHT